MKPTGLPWTVVGAGLAGSLICLELVRRKQSVRWIMDKDRPACSNIAAGMYNPITGKRFAKTWQTDVLQPFMESYYQEIEQQTCTRFLYPQPVMKLFTDSDERERWDARKEDVDFRRLAKPLDAGRRPAGLRDLGYGGFIIPNAGSVRVSTLLEAVKKTLTPYVDIIHGLWTPEMSMGRACIHCNGWRWVENTLLNHIPLRHAHGDVLTIKATGLGDTHIVNAGIYILPLKRDQFRVGATYDWNRLSPEPTQEGRSLLERRLEELLETSYQVTEHSAGIRPTTKRRTPVLGRLPNNPNHIVFNGLGSKGVLLAPYYARQLAEHLLDHSPLDHEVDIQTHL